MINKIYGQIFKKSPWDNFEQEDNVFTKKRKDRIIFLGNKKNSGGGKNFTKCKIYPIEKYLVNKNLEISLFEDRNGKKELFRKFLVPVK